MNKQEEQNLYDQLIASVKMKDINLFYVLSKKADLLPGGLITQLLRRLCRVPEYIPFFSILIRNISEVDFLETHQGVPLYSACEFEILADVSYLLERGVRPNLCKERCLKSAMFYNKNKVIEDLLVRYGANKSLAKKYKENPFLDIAIKDLSKQEIFDH